MNLHIHGIILPENIEKDIYIVDGHITFDKKKDAKTVVKNGYIIPGLVDAHVHVNMGEDSLKENAKKHLYAICGRDKDKKKKVKLEISYIDNPFPIEEKNIK